MSLDEPILPPALLGPRLDAEQQGEVRDRYLDWASLLKRVDASISGANLTLLEGEIAAINKIFSAAGLSIRLAPRARDQGYIRFVESKEISGCGNSRLGFGGNDQTINIYPNCFKGRTIHHEIMHALGMIRSWVGSAPSAPPESSSLPSGVKV